MENVLVLPAIDLEMEGISYQPKWNLLKALDFFMEVSTLLLSSSSVSLWLSFLFIRLLTC